MKLRSILPFGLVLLAVFVAPGLARRGKRRLRDDHGVRRA